MTAQEPVIDDREQEELFEALLARADSYVEDWDPHTNDVGRTLLRIFSTYESDVRKRLNEVPEKQLLAFLDSLEFSRRRPQAARTPLSFSVSTDLDRNVPIPGGTTAIADVSSGDSQQFELPQHGGFEATPAQLTDVLSVTPETDRIVDQSTVLDGGQIELFGGESVQSHTLYLENESAFNLEAGSSFSCRVETTGDAAALFSNTVWEYYGEDEEGSVGWHPLETVERGVLDDTETGVEALQAHLHESAAREQPDSETVAEQIFRVPGTVTTHEINGVESRWIRCERVGEPGDLPASIISITVHVASTDREDGLAPDMMLSNDVPLSADDGPIRPYGRNPHPPVMFFLACEEALTKPGATVELSFAAAEETEENTAPVPDVEETDAIAPEGGMGVLDGPPQISWEYWNGDGWTRIGSVTDETDCLKRAGNVMFEVPTDIAATTVSGHESVWIRARLVSGNYGRPAFEPPGDGSGGALVGEPDEPVYNDVTIQYERANQDFETVFSYNNASFSENLSSGPEPFTPFETLPDEEQTVYFGFDDRLENGPLTLFVPVEDSTYPPSFDPGVQWEYCTDPETLEWEKLDVQDQTAGLTERGIVMLTFPTATTAFELFGRECHWIRARVTEDEFDTPVEHQSTDDTAETVTTDTSAERTTTPPVLDGIYQNTQLAYNKVTIEDETLGSSDGSHDQSFTCAHAPVIDIEVWVDELSTLSAGECRRLEEQMPNATAAEYDSRGELTAFWIRWEAVDDFLDADPHDREYVVSRTLGTVDFGDGDNGKIPPSGQDNVKATYTTGGGSEGNVPARTVTDLKSSIALVDSVSNPQPADGGADIESTETLVRRSTNRIKHRNRAVTVSDYEQVANAAFPELARVTCEPEHSPDQTRVTVLIIPETEREKPVPSVELKHRVRETLLSHAPASVTANEQTDIVVRGPGYSDLSVEATVHARTVKSVSLLKTEIETRLDQYLHPLSGNSGDGWQFGEMPTGGSIEAVIQDVESVSTVLNFEATFTVGGERYSLAEYESQKGLPKDTLVCSGRHQITVTMTEE